MKNALAGSAQHNDVQSLRAFICVWHKGGDVNRGPSLQSFHYRQLLTDELTRRCAKNPRYSLRAFAASLGVDPGNLSRAMRGRSSLSPAYARRIASALALPPKVAAELVASSVPRRQAGGSGKTKERAEAAMRSFTNIDTALFDIIADPLHYAILELTATEDFKPNLKWVARALGATQISIRLAVERLTAVGLLTVKNDGGHVAWKKATPRIKTPGGRTSSAALRRHQVRVLQTAADAVDETPIEQRCNVSFTMPMDSDLIETARTEIEAFAANLCRRLSRGRRQRVYQLGVCLYPVQKLQKR